MVAPTRDEITSLFDAHAQGVSVSAEKARNYDDARTWVDPNGYRLSDRIWNGRESNREQINQILRDGVANRQDALVTAKQLEQFLNPAHAVVRDENGRIVKAESKGLSKTVRGRGGTGSHAARRLAVTEVSRAHAQEVGRVAKETPFAIGERWNLSPQHPKVDDCDDRASANVGLGPGVYPVDGFPRMPDHPWCMCYATIEVEPDDDKIVAALRQEFGLAKGPGLEALDLPYAELEADHPARAKEIRYGVDRMSPVERKAIDRQMDQLRGKIDQKHLDAIYDYSGQAHIDINRLARIGTIDGGPEAIALQRRRIDLMDDVFKGDHPELLRDRDHVVYRGMTVDKEELPEWLVNAKPGSVITDNAFMSTTLDSDVMNKFSHLEWEDREFFDSVEMTLLAPKDAPAMSQALFRYGEESELLFGRQTRVIIHSIDKDGGSYRIVGEILADDVPRASRITPILDDFVNEMGELSVNARYTALRDRLAKGEIDRPTYLKELKALKDEAALKKAGGKVVPKPDPIPPPKPPVIDKPPMPDPGLSIAKQYEILKDQQAKGLITRQDYLERLDTLKQRKALGKAAPKPAPQKLELEPKPGLKSAKALTKEVENATGEFLDTKIFFDGFKPDINVYTGEAWAGKGGPLEFLHKVGPKVAPRTTSGYAEFIEWEAGDIENIITLPTSSTFVSAQPKVTVSTVRRYMAKGAADEPIQAFKLNNEYWVIDGNHRLAALRANGAANVRVNLLDVDELVARLKPGFKPPVWASEGAQVVPAKVVDPFVDKVQARISKGLNTEADVREVGKEIREEIEAETRRRFSTAVAAPDPKVVRSLQEEFVDQTAFTARLERIPVGERNVSQIQRLAQSKEKERSILRELEKVKTAVSVDRQQVTRDVLSRVRPMGGKQSGLQFYTAGVKDQRALQAVEEALDYLPKGWADAISERANGKKFSVIEVDRGYYKDETHTIAISKKGPGLNVKTSIHELVHAFERASPQLMKRQREFFERRTKGESPTPLGYGYDKFEVSKKDKFLNPYMGKEYAQNYELATMGAEALLSPGYSGFDLLKDDHDMADFILGLLGGL